MYSQEEFDKNKIIVLKYIMYKKRTKQEVIQKFSNKIEESMFADIIEYLQTAGYIDDISYIR